MSAVQLIVGLGNPGPEYQHTRHNAGAEFVEQLAREQGLNFSPEKKFLGQCARFSHQGQDVHLLIPTTYMNRSGQAVAALANFYRIPPEAILIAHDELDLPPGTVRLKHDGGHGGHNGLRDIIASLGGRKDFYRLRLGIGHPSQASQVTGHVLGRAPKTEQELLQANIDNVIKLLPLILAGDWSRAMQQLHTQNTD